MMYIEIIELIKKIETGPREPEKLAILSNLKYKYSGNANIRLQNRFFDMINYRMKKAIDNFFNSLGGRVEQVQLGVEEFKRESNYCKELAKNNLLSQEMSESILLDINLYLNKSEDVFKTSFVDSNNETLKLLAQTINFGG